jgi:hypothetical protein
MFWKILAAVMHNLKEKKIASHLDCSDAASYRPPRRPGRRSDPGCCRLQLSSAACRAPAHKSKYNNWLIAELINIFADVEERRKERKKSLTLMQAPSWTRKHR